MTMQYLACEWLVKFEQVPKLKDLNELAKVLDGEFLIQPSFFFNAPVTDLLIVKLTESRTPHFTQQAQTLGFTAWRDVDPDLYVDEFAFNPYRKSAFTQRTWEARLRLAHHHNHLPKVKPMERLYPDQKSAFHDLETRARVMDSLKRSGIEAAGDLLDLFEKLGEDEILAIRNFGAKSVDELLEMLKKEGYLPNKNK